MATHRTYKITPEHRAVLNRIGAVAAYRMIIEGRRAPSNYSWHMFSRMVRTGDAHKFELALIDTLEVIDGTN